MATAAPASPADGSGGDEEQWLEEEVEEVISEQLTNELLLADDQGYVAAWQVKLKHEGLLSSLGVHGIPAGSQVEGAWLARNAADYRELEEEVDGMLVMGCISSPGGPGDDSGPVLVEVEDSAEHVLVTYPHPQLHVHPEVVQVQECGSPWLNGMRYKQWALQCCEQMFIERLTNLRALGVSWSMAGPSVAATIPTTSTIHLHHNNKVFASTLVEFPNQFSSAVSACRQLMADTHWDGRTIPVGILETACALLEILNTITALPLPRRVRLVLQSLLPALTSDVKKLVNMPIVERYMGEHNIMQLEIKELVASRYALPNAPAAAPSVSARDELPCILSHIERGIEISKIIHAGSLSPNLSFDKVPAIHVSVWPQQALQWVVRPREWPSDEVIEQVVRQGYHLVSKPRTHLPPAETECDWRISFSLSEQILARARSPRQKKAYYLLKVVYYKYLKPIGTSDTSLKSYACKTVMLWVSEEQDVRWWEENSTLTALTHLLSRLRKCLQERRMSYYFMPEVNLFDGWKTPQRVIDRCVAVITGLTDKPRQHMTRNMDILAHRLVCSFAGGDKPHDAQKLVAACEEVKTWIQHVLSVYTVTAETGIVGAGEQVGDVYEHLVEVLQSVSETLDDMLSEVSGGSETAAGESTSTLYYRVMDTMFVTAPGEPAEGPALPPLLSAFVWTHLLKAVKEFLAILVEDERCVDDLVMLEICKRGRRLVELMLPPHVLCDAQVLCDRRYHVTYRPLGNAPLINHFITVIYSMRRASTDIDEISDLIENLLPDSSTSDDTQAQPLIPLDVISDMVRNLLNSCTSGETQARVEDLGFHSLSLD